MGSAISGTGSAGRRTRRFSMRKPRYLKEKRSPRLQTIANASAISERLRNGEGAIGRTLAKDDPIATELDASIAAFRKACESFDGKETMAKAQALMDNLNAVAEKLRTGEGTLGKLVGSSELYDEVQGVTKDVRQVIDNYRDTTPISTFGSLIMGGL